MAGEIECPRCGEADHRSIGLNKCGLCECEFHVTARPRQSSHVDDESSGYEPVGLNRIGAKL